MAVSIPMQNAPSFIEQVVLDDTTFFFQFHWNTRGEFWSMDILDADKNELLTGRKMVLGAELTSRFPDLGLPDGYIFIDDNTDDETPIGRYDFTSDRALEVIFVSRSEVV